MDNRPIGVFDSGLGGLTAVRRLQELLPHEDIVYFGDTGRVPYGTRSRETIRRYAGEDCRLLLDRDVKFIIAACGTVSSVAPDILTSLPVPAIGVVEPTAAAAAAATRNGRVGIIGTAATIRSASFERALLAIRPDLHITATPCPLFVPLVENGWISQDDPVAIPMVRRYLTQIKADGADTLILGCTHFPLLTPIIQQELGSDVTLIDSGYETARLCAARLRETGQLSADSRPGQSRYYVSDQPEGFSQVAEIFLGHSVEQQVEMVRLDQP
ncbi:MAG: glutamate racemase [Clostridia bacterium]|nr:glutamate racemase [Clostridia bacterium]